MEPISVKNKSLSDVLTSVSSQFEKRKITFVSLGRSDVLNRKIEALELPSASAREFLTRLVQAAGPDVVWFLGGMKGSRALTISTL
jgi:hypothetical protein